MAQLPVFPARLDLTCPKLTDEQIADLVAEYGATRIAVGTVLVFRLLHGGWVCVGRRR